MIALPVVPRMRPIPLGAKTFFRARNAGRSLGDIIRAYSKDYRSAPPISAAECDADYEVFITTEYSVCNYQCPYCYVGWQPDDRKSWDSHDLFPKIVHRLARCRHRLKINLENLGEWFTNKELIDAATFLANLENVQWVSITTNASLLSRMFTFLDAVDPAKVAFTCTYHATEVSLDDYVDSVEQLKSRGAHVVIATVCFPTNVEHCEELKRRADAMGVHFRMNLEERLWNEEKHVPRELAERVYNLFEEHRKWDVQRMGKMTGANQTLGVPCTAGKRYLWINSYGDMFICSAAAALSVGAAKKSDVSFGNLFEWEEGSLPTRGDDDLICPYQGCLCPKDILQQRTHQDMLAMGEHSRHDVQFRREEDRRALLAKPPILKF